MQMKRVTVDDLLDKAKLVELLRANEPFVARGCAVPRGAYEATLDIFRRSGFGLWNQRNDFYDTFREAVVAAKTDACPCVELSANNTVASDHLDTSRDFQVVVSNVLPRTRMDRTLVQPAMNASLRTLGQVKSLKLFTSLFVSRGAARGGTHGHNFDTFSHILSSGRGTRVYLFPPAFYSRLRTRLTATGGAGVLTLHNLEPDDDMIDQAITFDAEPGDIVHTPFCWFHRFDHDGEYIDLASAWFFGDLLEDRLASVRRTMPDTDWNHLATQTRRLRYFRLMAPLDHVGTLVARKVPQLGRALRILTGSRSGSAGLGPDQNG